jgi:surface antigen
MLRSSLRFGLIAAAAPLLLLLVSAPTRAQSDSQQCSDTPVKKAKKSMFGHILGNIADSALGHAGVPSSVAGVSLPVGSLLSDAIMNLLDCHERQQAAQATDKAMRGGVGTEVAWTSETRPNVTGKSTVKAQQKLADGGQCLTVTDVVIVDGQETTVPKRMCRAAGASGYARA